MLCVFKTWLKAEVAFHFLADVWNLLNLAQFKHALRVVGDWTKAVHRNGDRTHSKESESDQTKREDWRGEIIFRRHQVLNVSIIAGPPTQSHERGKYQALPERGEITRHETGKNIQACATLRAGLNHFANVTTVGAGEDLGEFWNQRAGNGAQTNNDGKNPPQTCVGVCCGVDHGASNRLTGCVVHKNRTLCVQNNGLAELTKQRPTCKEGHANRND